MSSSGSLFVPSKLLAHLRLSWVISARWIEVDYCLLPRCVAIATKNQRNKKLDAFVGHFMSMYRPVFYKLDVIWFLKHLLKVLILLL
jgi:hypothetical protein